MEKWTLVLYILSFFWWFFVFPEALEFQGLGLVNGGTPIAGWFVSTNQPNGIYKNGWFRGNPQIIHFYWIIHEINPTIFRYPPLWNHMKPSFFTPKKHQVSKRAPQWPRRLGSVGGASRAAGPPNAGADDNAEGEGQRLGKMRYQPVIVVLLGNLF